MPISTTCECGRIVEAPEEHAGGVVPCPDCGRSLAVPKPKPTLDDEFFGSDSGPTATSGKAIASLVVGSLVFLLFLSGVPAILLGCRALSLIFLLFLSGVPAILLGRRALSDIHLSGGRLRGRGMAITGIILGLIGCLLSVGLFLAEVRSAREAARRAQCTSNLKQIGLALHNYHHEHGCLPSAAITDDEGRPLLSWRVALLPYLDGGTLYEQFRLDEPWDSPHNLPLVDAMPGIFACPSDLGRNPRREPGTTNYRVVIGPDTCFRPDLRPVAFEEVTDGLSQTLLVGESRHRVPWSKPEGLPFDMTLPLTGLGSLHGHHNNGFNVLVGDGTVRFLRKSIEPAVLKALLTRNGGETITPDQY